MPQCCCVKKCNSRANKRNMISFHCFPKQGTIWRERWLKALGLKTLNWNTKPRVCSRHFRKEDFVIGGNYVKLSKYAVPSTQEPSCGNTQNLPTTSSTTVIDTCNQMDSVPHLEEIATLCRNTKLSTSTDSSTEVSMSWSNESGNSSKVNTTNKAFNPVSRNVSEDQCYTEDQLNSFISSTPKQRFTNKTIEEAQHFPMDMTWISKENSTAEDKLTVSTSTQMVLSQKSTSHENIVRNEMSRDNVESETCKCSKTVDKLEKEIKYLNKNMKRLQESVQSKALFNLERFSCNDKKILYYTGFQTYQLLMIAFNWVLPSGDIKDIAIHVKPDQTVGQHLNKLSAENQFFLTLVRLRRGLAIETLEDMFSISKSSVDNIFLCWINLMYLRLGCLDIWPNRDILISRASDSMKEKYPTVIGSLDCTEFFIQRPSSLQKQSQCYKL